MLSKSVLSEPDALILGLDACLDRCSAALLQGEKTMARASEHMLRGHVERLGPMVDELFSSTDISPDDLDLIGVTCGPGGFTGARLGVAFVRGLALAAGCRCVGIGTLTALHGNSLGALALIDGKRGQVFAGGAALSPMALPLADVARLVQQLRAERVICHGALDWHELVGGDADIVTDASINVEQVARLAHMSAENAPIAAPIYLREPDARPQV